MHFQSVISALACATLFIIGCLGALFYEQYKKRIRNRKKDILYSEYLAGHITIEQYIRIYAIVINNALNKQQ